MKSLLKLDKDNLQELAIRFYDMLQSADTKHEGLLLITEYIKTEIGDFFGPEILAHHDEFSLTFIEILDQIIFELVENSPSDETIKDYITEDLYLRLRKFLDILYDKDVYKHNLNNGFLINEDTIIIKHFLMEEYLPELMTEFYEQPALKKPILKALLAFNSSELFNFYYQVIKDENCIETKILSLTGLKTSIQKFTNWKHLKTNDIRFNKLIEYVKNFDIDNIYNNQLPDDINTFLFVMYYIENHIIQFNESLYLNWAIDVLKTISTVDIESSFTSEIYTSISNILIYFDNQTMKDLLRDEVILQSFLTLIDMIPPEIFNRVVMKLTILGDDFKTSAQKHLSNGKIKNQEGESNIMSFLLWDSNGTIP